MLLDPGQLALSLPWTKGLEAIEKFILDIEPVVQVCPASLTPYYDGEAEPL
jgi:hypothetical protein